MHKSIAAIAKQIGGALSKLPPPTIESVEKAIVLFKKKNVTSVTVELACYGDFPRPRYKLAIDYTGINGRKKVIRRKEVLHTIEGQSTDERLIQELKKFYPDMKERVKKLRNELGVDVTIPDRVKALTATLSHATRPDAIV